MSLFRAGDVVRYDQAGLCFRVVAVRMGREGQHLLSPWGDWFDAYWFTAAPSGAAETTRDRRVDGSPAISLTTSLVPSK